MAWYDELRDDIDTLREETGASDRQLAEAARTVLQRQAVIAPFHEEESHENTLYRLTWWMFVRATALDLRQFIYSSMALEVITSGARGLDETLDELEELEAQYSPETPAPAPVEDSPALHGLKEAFRKNATFADKLYDMDVEGIEPLITHAVEELLKHGELFRELSRSVAEGLVDSFGEIAKNKDIEDTLPEAGDHDHHVAHHHEDYEALDSTEAYIERAEERYEQGEVDGAVDDLTGALELGDLGDREADVYHKRGVARAAMENVDGAIEDWNRALELNDEHAGALVDRALARQNQGDVEAALEDYNRAAEAWEMPGIFANRGVARFLLGDVDGAMADFEHALELDDETLTAYLNRAKVRRAAGDTQGALKDFDRAIELDDECAEAYAGRGFLRMQYEEYDPAIRDLEAAIEQQPGQAEHYYNLGNAWAAKGEFQKAVEQFDEAIEHDPEDAQAYSNRGTAKIQLEDFRGAIDDWDKAVELDPYQPMPYLKRAAAWNLLDQEDEAIHNLTRCLEVAEDDWPHRQRARLMLEELK